MSERITMQVTMQVTIPQALALKAMFNQWNRLAGWGSSRYVGFYVDGDGNFKPQATCTFFGTIPHLTEEMEEIALVNRVPGDDRDQNTYMYDFDPIAWKLRELNQPVPAKFHTHEEIMEAVKKSQAASITSTAIGTQRGKSEETPSNLPSGT